jgi:hypothetical protein
MKPEVYFKYFSMIFGIVITCLLLFVFAPKIIGKIIEEGFSWLFEMPGSFSELWDNPMAFILIYLIGYVVVWWKPLWGSLIIMIVSVYYVPASGTLGSLIFALPTFLVGLFYLVYFIMTRKKE